MSEMLFAVRFNVRSWQLLLLMASAKCCAPMCEILFRERFNVCSWQLLLLMASAKCCAPMSEILFCERFNVCSWQLLLLLMALAKYFAASSVNWFHVRFNQLSWDSLHFNNFKISRQPNRPMSLPLKFKRQICCILITFTNEEQSTAVRWQRIKFTQLKFICWSFLRASDFILLFSFKHLINVTANSRSSLVGQQVTFLCSSFSVHCSL